MISHLSQLASFLRVFIEATFCPIHGKARNLRDPFYSFESNGSRSESISEA